MRSTGIAKGEGCPDVEEISRPSQREHFTGRK